MSYRKMLVEDWIKVEDNPIQRDTEKHAAKAKHLMTPHPSHSFVFAAELPNGKLIKLDGHTRALMWRRKDVSPPMQDGLRVIEAWGFEYKTCAFDWMKASVSTLDLFPDPKSADMKLGHWTRSNSEPCLLATRGKPKRLDAGVRMGIIESARQHSRKPDCVPERIERLVAGPYLELFARTTRDGWSSWENQTGKFISS